MKLLTFGFMLITAIAAPQIAVREPSVPPVAPVAMNVSTSLGQMENYLARMNQATQELDGILEDLEQMNPEQLMHLEPVLAALITRQDELVEVIALGDEGLKEGKITEEDEIRTLNELIDPEISEFEDAVFRLRSALDEHLQLRAEI